MTDAIGGSSGSRGGGDRRPPLPARLSSAERKFHSELRRLVDASGLSARELADISGIAQGYGETPWEGWLNGESVPPLRVVRELAAKLVTDGIDAGLLVGLWAQAFLPTAYPAQPGHPPGRPQQLPDAVWNFMGRVKETEVLEDLARQAAAVSSDGAGSSTRGGGAGSSTRGGGSAQSGRAAVVVIEGPAGVGKTTLAIHVAQRVKDRFPDGHLYVSLRGGAVEPVSDSDALRGFLEALGVPSRELPMDADARAALYRRRLAGRRVLVVIDNARDWAHVRRLFPVGPGSLVLITTRTMSSGLADAGVHVLRLDPFTDSEARDLLERRLGAARLRDEQQAAAELSRLCGRLPLALSVAAARVAADPGLRLAALTGALRSRGLGDATADPAVIVRTVFEESCAHLSQHAARLLRMLGACPGPDISLPAAASLAAVTLEQAHMALEELTAVRLVEEQRPGRFSLHDLLRDYAAELAHTVEASAGIDEATRRLLDYYLRGMLAAVDLLYPRSLPVALPEPAAGVREESFGSQAQALAWSRAELPTVRSLLTHAARRGGFDTYCWQLPVVMAPVLMRGGFVHDYLAAERVAITAAGNLGDLLGQGLAHYEFAHACALLGEVGDSETHLKEALRWFTKADDQAAAAQAINAMAQLLAQDGKYEQALQREKEALELRRAVGDPNQIAHSEQTIGEIYAQLGRHDEAMRHCQRALDLSRETGNRALAAEALDALGFVHLSLGDHDKAVACYLEALVIYREIGDNLRTAQALTGLGDAQHAKGDADAAGASWRQAMLILSDVPNADIQPIRARLAPHVRP